MKDIPEGFMDGVYFMWEKTIQNLEKNAKYDLSPDSQIDYINDVGMAIRDQCEKITIEKYGNLIDVESNLNIKHLIKESLKK